MQIAEATIAVTAVLSILFFSMYVLALLRLPTGRRPKTRTIDRFGQPLPASENPGYQETEDETHW